MEPRKGPKKSLRQNEDGDSNSEGAGRNIRSPARPPTKPAQDGDTGVINADGVSTASNISNENVRKPRRRNKKRTSRQTKTKEMEPICQPDSESTVEIQKPAIFSTNDNSESEVQIGRPTCKNHDEIPSISTETVPSENTWIRLRKVVTSSITRQFDRLSSQFVLDFPPRPRKTQREPEIVPEYNPPKLILKTAKPEPQVAVAVAAKTPAVATVLPRKKFSILELRKSRAERGVKSLKIDMAFGIMVRKEQIRRNPKGFFGNKIAVPRTPAKQPALPEIQKEPEPEEQTKPMIQPMSMPYGQSMTFDRNDLILTSSYRNHVQESPESAANDRETNPVTRFGDAEGFLTHLDYYPKTAFTAQFAHLLPISRY